MAYIGDGYLNIYSNDGSTLLGYYAATINEDGSNFGIVMDNLVEICYGKLQDAFSYSGSLKFLGLATEPNATVPTYTIGDKFIWASNPNVNDGEDVTNLYIVEGHAIKGKWRFNDTMTDTTISSPYIKWAVSFASNGVNCDSITCAHGEADSYDLYYGKEVVANIPSPSGAGSWINENYKLIDFGSTEQTVPNDFYTWLITNAARFKVTDLTNTTWYVPSGWQATAGYGQFAITGLYNGAHELGFIDIGYYATDAWDNGIDLSGVPLGNTEDFTLNITGGTDVQNVALIAWLTTYGIQLKVTDLRNTTWNVPTGWEAEAGYGDFSIVNITSTHAYETQYFRVGYTYVENDDGSYRLIPQADSIICDFGAGLTYGNEFTVTFWGGTDATNPKLIAWLSQYGELSATVPDIIAKVFYGDTLLAELRAGQQATLHCTEKIMEHNVVVQKVKDSADKVTVSTSTEMPTYEAEYDAGLTVVCDGKIMPEDVAVEVIS